eukprot:TRINITY_DN18472_c0_g1_i1.p1 TRINITY_DN18472_c0_g1~~TRINITY_DN18472_c0_g1_i1.p1  ORF type:complete len:309 (+),score=58.19 TRINITY_DN18472_c0_g1_i1:61-987(+)
MAEPEYQHNNRNEESSEMNGAMNGNADDYQEDSNREESRGMRGGKERGALRTGVGPYEDHKELTSKMLQIQSKRYYFDVKENRRGRFIKVAEIASDGRRDQIFLAMSTAAEFRDHLTSFSEFYATLDPYNSSEPKSPSDDGRLKSDLMIKDNRRYYMDLKENARGRFLRVAQVTQGVPRTFVAIPAQGLVDFRNVLSEILDEFGCEDGGHLIDLPISQHIRLPGKPGKNFHFDVGQNNRGVYMKISEVGATFRTNITVPRRSWKRFRDIIDQFMEQVEAPPETGRRQRRDKRSGPVNANHENEEDDNQ